ncbi:hypothetical protein JCM10908_001741 [Rhodotorula pacifica]|uniref:uncharacterized protein n=1 Tax=Rhodotorula pacifica TaxID=1495444 RepID=UPI00317518FB
MHRGLKVFLLSSVATTVSAAPPASRTVRVVNKCSYDVYPAVAPFPELAEPYKDERGWHAAPDTSKDITIPGTFLGRIWARHGCAPSGEQINCVTGGCRENKLACADGEMGGGATSVELRLRTVQNGEYDVYDLNNGAGWGVPVSIKPAGDKCDSITCTPVLATCPDSQLVLSDSYGQILGCRSACYGGVGDSDQQCCKGAFSDGAKCTPDLIQFYDYFKTPCQHAYAYYQDSRQGSPTVNYMCKAEGEPGFMVTFCPDGDGDSAGPNKGGATGTGATATGKKTKTGEGATEGGATETGKIGQPTGTAPISQPKDIPAISSVASLNITSTNAAEATSQASATSAGGSTNTTPAATEAATPTDTSATAADSSASDSALSETPGGISKTAMIGVGAGIAIVAVLGVVVACVISRRKNAKPAAVAKSKPAAAAGAAPAGADSDIEAGTARNTGFNPAQSDNALGRGHSRRSQRGRRALLSASSESDHSSSDDLKELYSDHSDSSHGHRRRASRRSSGRR